MISHDDRNILSSIAILAHRIEHDLQRGHDQAIYDAESTALRLVTLAKGLHVGLTARCWKIASEGDNS